MFLFCRKIIGILNRKILLKEREEAKKKGSTFHHKVEGKMIKKVMRKVKFIYCI